MTASDGEEGDFFGCSISTNGDYAIVGADSDDDKGDSSGSAYIFKRDGTNWSEQVKLTAPDGIAYDHFGFSVSLNSDYSINDKHLNYLGVPYLVAWFGQNINVVHPKLHSIPIGIANEIWDHGNEDTLLKIIIKENEKNKLIHCSFDVNTNRYERYQCVDAMYKNNLLMNQRENFEDYLTSLSKSFFTLSPNGNGIDCHKLWESLYLKTIPIVTKSINVDFYKDLPIYIIDSWRDFNVNDLNEDLYYKIIK